MRADLFRWTNLTDPVRASVALTAAYVVHLTEEWLCGFSEWSRVIRGAGVAENEFIVINAIFLAAIVGLTLIARQRKGMAWFPAVLAAVFALNGVLHALASLRYEVYSPGTATGLLISLPLGMLVLREMKAQLSASAFVGCLVAGGMVHAIVTFVAFR